MLLATSVFGATQLNINDRAALPNDVSPDAAGVFTLTFSLVNPSQFQLAGYSLAPTSASAGAVTLVTRTNTNLQITDPTSTQGAVQNKLVDTLMATDLGYTGDFDTKFDASANIPLMVLTVKLAAGATVPQPLSFKIIAYDLGFNSETSTASVNLVPEPASMMLLAAGAAFFARRRRNA